VLRERMRLQIWGVGCVLGGGGKVRVGWGGGQVSGWLGGRCSLDCGGPKTSSFYSSILLSHLIYASMFHTAVLLSLQTHSSIMPSTLQGM